MSTDRLTGSSCGDVDLDFPYRVFKHEGQDIEVDLVEIRAGEHIQKFRSLDELQRSRPSETLRAPVSIEPNEQLSLRLEETLVFTFDGKQFNPEDETQALQLLGPFLDLEPDGQGYRCAVGHQMDAVMDFEEGEVRRRVEQSILPAGCTLRIPE